MNNEEIFIKANKALAEGNYEEFIEYCAEDINGLMLAEVYLMEKQKSLNISALLIMI